MELRSKRSNIARFLALSPIPTHLCILTHTLTHTHLHRYASGEDVYPCPPSSSDNRPFIKGLDHIGTGIDMLTGEQKEPLFEWNAPDFYQASYDSGVYNAEEKIPEQLIVTSIPSGQGGLYPLIHACSDIRTHTHTHTHRYGNRGVFEL